MPTTYEDLYDKDGTIYKTGVDGGADTPYATPEDLAGDLGIGSDEIDWGAINPYAPPPQDVPQETPAGATDILPPVDTELTDAEADYYETLTPEYREEQRAQSDADIMKKYQQEIDALEAERVAARGRITSQYGQIGKERQGTSTAVQSRRGLIGSTMGIQHKSELTSQTQREQDAAIAYSSAQYSERKRAIMGDVRTAQSEEAKLRLEAAQLGSQAKIEEIRGRKIRSDERVSATIKNMLSMEMDVEDEELMAEVAEGLGISVKDLMSKYESVKSEAEEAQRILDEEQLDREMKRNLTQAQIDKIENDKKNIDRKFEEDVRQYGEDYAMKEKEFALDKWEAEQKATIDRYKAYKSGSSGGYSQKDLDKLERDEETKFWKEVDESRTRLTKGENWGTVWDRLKSQFPDAPDDFLDQVLGTEWREDEAYEKYREKTKGSSTNDDWFQEWLNENG